MSYSTSISFRPKVVAFFDPDTNTISYVVKDPDAASCVVVDPVMDIDYAAGWVSYRSALNTVSDLEQLALGELRMRRRPIFLELFCGKAPLPGLFPG